MQNPSSECCSSRKDINNQSSRSISSVNCQPTESSQALNKKKGSKAVRWNLNLNLVKHTVIQLITLSPLVRLGFCIRAECRGGGGGECPLWFLGRAVNLSRRRPCLVQFPFRRSSAALAGRPRPRLRCQRLSFPVHILICCSSRSCLPGALCQARLGGERLQTSRWDSRKHQRHKMTVPAVPSAPRPSPRSPGLEQMPYP